MNEAPPIPITPPAPKNCGLAVWSLVLGILAIVLSVVCIGPLLAIPAVICGHMAYSRIKSSAGALTGDGLALGGLITGYVSFALIPIIGILAAIAVPNFVKARATAQMHACINNLRIIEGAKQQWALENKKVQTDTPTAQELNSYIAGGFGSLQCPAGGVYTINAAGAEATCSIPGHTLSGTTSGNSL
jgi:competence protein ComGC